MQIVSRCPSLTELAFDLLRGADVVGLPRYCVYPAADVARIEEVRGPNPKIGRVVELTPDIVSMNKVELSAEPFPLEAAHVEELAGETSFSQGRFRVVDFELLSLQLHAALVMVSPWGHAEKSPGGVERARLACLGGLTGRQKYFMVAGRREQFEAGRGRRRGDAEY